jgi:hypothetical protein
VKRKASDHGCAAGEAWPDGLGRGEAVDEEQAAAGLGLRVRMRHLGRTGTTRARVGDGEPVVAVGGPQDEFHKIVVMNLRLQDSR